MILDEYLIYLQEEELDEGVGQVLKKAGQELKAQTKIRTAAIKAGKKAREKGISKKGAKKIRRASRFRRWMGRRGKKAGATPDEVRMVTGMSIPMIRDPMGAIRTARRYKRS